MSFKPHQKEIKVNVKKLLQAGKLIYEALEYKHSKRLGIKYFYGEIMYKIVSPKGDKKIVFE